RRGFPCPIASGGGTAAPAQPLAAPCVRRRSCGSIPLHPSPLGQLAKPFGLPVSERSRLGNTLPEERPGLARQPRFPLQDRQRGFTHLEKVVLHHGLRPPS